MPETPILRPSGEQPYQPPKRIKVGASLGGIPYRVNEFGLIGEFAEGTHVPRELYMDGEQLLAAVAGVVRNELRHEGRECAVPNCVEGGVNVAVLGLGDRDPLAVNVWLCQAHGEQVDEVMAGGETGAPELTDEQQAHIAAMEHSRSIVDAQYEASLREQGIIE